VREQAAFLSADRAMEQELRLCIGLIRSRHWMLYE
jgi:histidine ammonia-lyase